MENRARSASRKNAGRGAENRSCWRLGWDLRGKGHGDTKRKVCWASACPLISHRKEPGGLRGSCSAGAFWLSFALELLVSVCGMNKCCKTFTVPRHTIVLPVVLEISTSAGSETSYGRSPDPNILTINWETPADALCARARFRQSTQRMWSCLFLPPPLVAVLPHAALLELCMPMLVGTKTPQPSCQSCQLVNRCGFVRAPVVLVLHC